MTPASAIKTQSADRRNIHSLSREEKCRLMREEFSGESRFQREFGTDAKEFDCAPHAQALRNEVIRLLEIKGIKIGKSLESLHETLPQAFKDYNFDDGVNKLSTLLYDADEPFYAVYHRFIKECVAQYFPYPFYFQATTTTRIHCPGGVNANHYPRYHSDIGYGHPPQEINIWIPLTELHPPQQHGFRRMSVEDSRKILEPFDYDFGPFIDKAINDKSFNAYCDSFAPEVETPFGKLHAFDSRCIHTGEPLREHTRASIDIRILPVSDFKKMPVEYQGTGRRRIVYVAGQAYHPLSSDKL